MARPRRRLVPRQRLSLEEALHGFTTGPAYAAGLEDQLGRLAPGYLADLIVLDQDPFRCPPRSAPACSPRHDGRRRMGLAGLGEMKYEHTVPLSPEVLVPRLGDYLVEKGLIRQR
jgi:cytosine/adenosine deaminase-related metal-dependent hydrolase